MKIIKNATIYKATLPSNDALTKHVEEAIFTDITPAMLSTSGFVLNKATGALVSRIGGDLGVALTVRHDEKILPRGAVNAAIDKAMAEAIEAKGELLTKEEVEDVKARTYSHLVATALVKTTTITGLYHRESELLVVLTPSKAMASIFINRLINAVGSVKTSTINVSDVRGGLTTRLKNYLAGAEAAFDGFNLGDSCVLKGDTGKASFDLDNLDTARQGLSEGLAAKMMVERLELEHGSMSFKLTHDFSLRGITYFGELTEDEQTERDDMDSGQVWAAEAAIQLLQLSAAVGALCELFGYNEERDAPKGEGEQEAEEAADAEV